MRDTRKLICYIQPTCCLMLVLSLLTGRSAVANTVEYQDFTIGGFVLNQVEEAVRGANQARNSAQSLSQEIQQARSYYFDSIRSGRSNKDARAAFTQKLLVKKNRKLKLKLVTGVSSQQTRLLERMAPVDGGIRAKKAFDRWASSVRFHMGASGPNDLMLINPIKFIDALRRPSIERDIYIRARDRAELFASEIPLDKLFSRRTFVKLILETRLSESGLREDPVAATERYYAKFSEEFTEKELLDAAEELLKIPATKWGSPKSFEIIDIPPSGKAIAPTYYDALMAMLERTSLKAYIVRLRTNSFASYQWRKGVDSGFQLYAELAQKYGERRVSKVTKMVWDAPKMFNGFVADTAPGQAQKPLWWIENLLKNPQLKAPVMKAIPFAVAHLPDTLSTLMKRGGLGKVYGRVAEVRIDRVESLKSAFLDLVTEKKNVTVQIYDIRYEHRAPLRKKFGPNLKGMIGQLIKTEGRLSEWEKVWTLNIFRNPIVTLDESDWPKEAPLPPSVAKKIKLAHVDPTRKKTSTPAPRPSAPYKPKFSDVEYQAHFLGKYQAMVEICSGTTQQEIKSEFYRAAKNSFPNKLSTSVPAYERSYAEVMSKTRVNCGEHILDSGYQRFKNTIAMLTGGSPTYKPPAKLKLGLVDNPLASKFSQSKNSQPKTVSTPKSKTPAAAERPTPTIVPKTATTVEPRRPSKHAGQIARRAPRQVTYRQAKITAQNLGKYLAISELCSNNAGANARSVFLDKAKKKFPTRITDLDSQIDSAYNKFRKRLSRFRKCQQRLLQRSKVQFERGMSKFN